MAADQISATLLGINSRLSGPKGRIDAMHQNLTALIRAQSAKLRARLRHVEEKLGLR